MYLVTRHTDRPAFFDDLIARFGFTETTLERLSPPRAQTDILIIDLSLPDAAVIRARITAFQQRKCPRIFLVDKGSHLETAQAWAAGASHVVSRAADTTDIIALISVLMQQQAERVAASVLETLERSSASLARGQRLDGAAITESAEDLVGAVSATGVSHWLNLCWHIDEATSQHSMLVAGIAAGFAQSLGLSRTDRLLLTEAAILHDIGKARIAPEILNKPGALTPEERAAIRRHPELGWRMLVEQGYGNERLRDAVLHHHEMLDGSGYPHGLAGSDISDSVRIITLSDIYGALRERRSYKPVQGVEEALAQMASLNGKLDPDLFREFRRFARATGESTPTALGA